MPQHEISPQAIDRMAESIILLSEYAGIFDVATQLGMTKSTELIWELLSHRTQRLNQDSDEGIGIYQGQKIKGTKEVGGIFGEKNDEFIKLAAYERIPGLEEAPIRDLVDALTFLAIETQDLSVLNAAVRKLIKEVEQDKHFQVAAEHKEIFIVASKLGLKKSWELTCALQSHKNNLGFGEGYYQGQDLDKMFGEQNDEFMKLAPHATSEVIHSLYKLEQAGMNLEHLMNVFDKEYFEKRRDEEEGIENPTSPEDGLEYEIDKDLGVKQSEILNILDKHITKLQEIDSDWQDRNEALEDLDEASIQVGYTDAEKSFAPQADTVTTAA